MDSDTAKYPSAIYEKSMFRSACVFLRSLSRSSIFYNIKLLNFQEIKNETKEILNRLFGYAICSDLSLLKPNCVSFYLSWLKSATNSNRHFDLLLSTVYNPHIWTSEIFTILFLNFEQVYLIPVGVPYNHRIDANSKQCRTRLDAAFCGV